MAFVCLGGDIQGGRTGFVGCLRNLFVQGSLISDIPIGANTGGVINGSCNLEDRYKILFQAYAQIFTRYAMSQMLSNYALCFSGDSWVTGSGV